VGIFSGVTRELCPHGKDDTNVHQTSPQSSIRSKSHAFLMHPHIGGHPKNSLEKDKENLFDKLNILVSGLLIEEKEPATLAEMNSQGLLGLSLNFVRILVFVVNYVDRLDLA
jgi:hypothetical protein